MKHPKPGRTLSRPLRRAALAMLLPLIFAMLSCNFSAGADPNVELTEVAGSVQSTIDAQLTAAALSEPTSAATDTPPPQQDLAEPSPTLPEPSPTPPPPTATLEPTPTSIPTPVGPIEFTQWELVYWVPLSSGCKFAGQPCWRTNDNFERHFGSQLIMTSKDSVQVDPAWPRPFLTFWHLRDLKADAALLIEADGNWIQARNYNQTKMPWQQEAIDLTPFLGQTIRVRFQLSGSWGSGVPNSTWYVQAVQVEPNFRQ